jgi:uncharacterized repeat protein (TIGR04138 family)
MIQVHLADDLLSRILAREPRYAEQAHLFVLASIEYLQSRLPFRRHVTGQELALAVRDHALDEFGLMAPAVLRHWGIEATVDVGRIVFALVDVGLLVAQPLDRLEDFEGVWEIETAFEERAYRWAGIPSPGDGGTSRQREAM